MKKKSYLITGYVLLFAIFSIIVSVVGYALNTTVFNADHIYILFPKTGTLLIDDDFTWNGVVYGTISNIIRPESDQALVEVRLRERFPIYKGYSVNVLDKGIFGQRNILFENGPGPDLFTGDTLRGGYYRGISDILGSMHLVDTTFRRVQDLIQQSFQHNGVELINSFIDSYSSLEHNIHHFRDAIGKAEMEIDNLLAEVSNIQKEGEKLLQRAEGGLSTLYSKGDEILPKISKSIEGIGPKIEDLIALAIDAEKSINSGKGGETLHEIEEGLKDLTQTIHSIHEETHRLKLLINRFNKDQPKP